MDRKIIDISEQGLYTLALRKYSESGSYFLIRISKVTGDIIGIEKLAELPANWPEDYILELMENGKVLNSSIFTPPL